MSALGNGGYALVHGLELGHEGPGSRCVYYHFRSAHCRHGVGESCGERAAEKGSDVKSEVGEVGVGSAKSGALVRLPEQGRLESRSFFGRRP